MISRFDGVEIIKNKNHVFELKFKQSSPALVNSLLKTKLIKGHTDDTYSKIIFKAHSVKTLKEYQVQYKEQHGKMNMLVSDTAKAIRSLTMQLSYLLTHEHNTILGYNPEYIININDETFIFCGSELIVPLIEETNTVMICYPFSHIDFYYSPEMKNITEIPVFIHYKTSYFSFACLIIFLLTGNNDFYTTFLKESSNPIQAIENHPIKNTKIYWLISRCLEEEYDKRVILLI